VVVDLVEVASLLVVDIVEAFVVGVVVILLTRYPLK
jgi:hypothetical protein